MRLLCNGANATRRVASIERTDDNVNKTKKTRVIRHFDQIFRNVELRESKISENRKYSDSDKSTNNRLRTIGRSKQNVFVNNDRKKFRHFGKIGNCHCDENKLEIGDKLQLTSRITHRLYYVNVDENKQIEIIDFSTFHYFLFSLRFYFTSPHGSGVSEL